MKIGYLHKVFWSRDCPGPSLHNVPGDLFHADWAHVSGGPGIRRAKAWRPVRKWSEGAEGLRAERSAPQGRGRREAHTTAQEGRRPLGRTLSEGQARGVRWKPARGDQANDAGRAAAQREGRSRLAKLCRGPRSRTGEEEKLPLLEPRIPLLSRWSLRALRRPIGLLALARGDPGPPSLSPSSVPSRRVLSHAARRPLGGLPSAHSTPPWWPRRGTPNLGKPFLSAQKQGPPNAFRETPASASGDPETRFLWLSHASLVGCRGPHFSPQFGSAPMPIGFEFHFQFDPISHALWGRRDQIRVLVAGPLNAQWPVWVEGNSSSQRACISKVTGPCFLLRDP